ncbi:MAG: hypothetical protein JWM28_301 [Chitinophagaceae bacterium]|nr:hypothetical protein [Chitinophagaceae bacterium]
MKTIFRFSVMAAALLSIIIYSCSKDDSSTAAGFANLDRPHKAQIFLTDHQTPIFDSVFIDIRELELKLEDDTLANDGWVMLAIRPGIYNILRLRNGLDTLFGTGDLPNGRIKKVRLTLGNQNTAILKGQSFALNIHDNRGEIIADLDDSNFEIVGANQVLFWIDFDVAKSIKEDNSGDGNSHGYELEPHINIFTKHKSGSLEGKVLPEEANALVMAIQGTDTTLAIPEDDDGEFKILGLKEGSYNIFIDGNNGYRDTTINAVVVTKNEDSHLGVITLHK